MATSDSKAEQEVKQEAAETEDTQAPHVSQPAEIGAKKKNGDESANDFDIKWLEGTSAAKELKSKSSHKQQHSGKYSDPAYKKISRINGQINEMSVDELTNSLKALEMDTK